MPAASARQRRWAFAAKGEAWARAHHMDKVRPKKKQKRGRDHRGEVDALVRELRK